MDNEIAITVKFPTCAVVKIDDEAECDGHGSRSAVIRKVVMAYFAKKPKKNKENTSND